MYKTLTLRLAVLVIAFTALTLSSCKDDEDDDKSEPSTVSFVSASKTVGEGDQNVEAKIVLSSPAETSVIVSYSLSGSATRKIGANAGDYEVPGGAGEVEIAAGQTTGSIVLNILEDNILEANEKIIITIDDVSSSAVEIGTADQMEITIQGGSATVSFATTTLTVNESDEGAHEIVVQLAQASSSDVVVTYELGSPEIEGNALDSITGYNEDIPEDYWDYYIDGTSGEVVIPAGETSATIDVVVFSDVILENDETIEITLKASSGVTIGTNEKIEITVKQEDGMVVELDWADASNSDMDLFIWFKNNSNQDVPFIISANGGNTPSYEQRIIPKVLMDILEDAITADPISLGASYNYYGGAATTLDFDVYYVPFVNGDFVQDEEEWRAFSGTYTDANKFPWDEEEEYPRIAQRFEYSNGVYSNFTELDIAETGSRVGNNSIDFAKLSKRLQGVMMPLKSPTKSHRTFNYPSKSIK
jgi:hypothetical protein